MNHRSRTLLAVAIALLTVSAPAWAQVPPAIKDSTSEQRAKMLTAVMKEKLALTPEQLPKVEAINLEAAQKMEPVLKGTEGPLVKLRTSKAVEAARESALQGVLTPVQFQGYLAAREEMKQKAEQRMLEKKQ